MSTLIQPQPLNLTEVDLKWNNGELKLIITSRTPINNPSNYDVGIFYFNVPVLSSGTNSSVIFKDIPDGLSDPFEILTALMSLSLTFSSESFSSSTITSDPITPFTLSSGPLNTHNTKITFTNSDNDTLLNWYPEPVVTVPVNGFDNYPITSINWVVDGSSPTGVLSIYFTDSPNLLGNDSIWISVDNLVQTSNFKLSNEFLNARSNTIMNYPITQDDVFPGTSTNEYYIQITIDNNGPYYQKGVFSNKKTNTLELQANNSTGYLFIGTSMTPPPGPPSPEPSPPPTPTPLTPPSTNGGNGGNGGNGKHNGKHHGLSKTEKYIIYGAIIFFILLILGAIIYYIFTSSSAHKKKKNGKKNDKTIVHNDVDMD